MKPKEPELLLDTCMTPWKYDDGDCDDCEECNRCKMYQEDTDKREGRDHAINPGRHKT